MSTLIMPTTLTPMTFWFLRHGETNWNIDSLAQGNVDIPLNENGIAQARDSAVKLRNRGIRTIVSSTLSRARDTAEIVAETLGLPVELDDGLREVSFGANEGLPIADQWFSDWVNGIATPQGAESFVDLRVRAIEAVNRALAKTAPVLVVAHGGFFRALRADMGLEPNVRTPNGTPYFCEPGNPWTLSEAK
jgi:2,3-bisphosphoglycerate-dependent phosphoglycerate mutase